MGGTVIAEFLASVGFMADEKSMKASLAKVAAFSASVQLVAGGIYASLIKVASGETEIAHRAEVLGTTSDKLRELGYIAELNDSSMQAVNSTLEAMVAKNPRIKDAAKALELAGERMKGMSDAQRRFFADQMGIDRSLIPMLVSDTGKLSAEFQEMYRIAGTDSKSATQASRAFMAEISKMTTMVKLLARSVAMAFIGRIRNDVAQLRKAIIENFAKIKMMLEVTIKVVLRVAGVIGSFVYRIIKWITAIVTWYSNLDDSQKKLVIGVGLLLAAWKMLNAGFLATPLGIVIAGLAGIVALIDDYLTFMEGGESYFDWSPWVGTIESARLGLLKIVKAVGKFISNNQELLIYIGKGIALFLGLKAAILGISGVLSVVTTAVRVLWGILAGNPLGLIITAAFLIYQYWEPISDFFQKIWAKITDALPDFGGWAKLAVGKIKEFFGNAVAWVREKIGKLIQFLPKSIRQKIGLSVENDSQDLNELPLNKKIHDLNLQNYNFESQKPLLTPSPAQISTMNQQNKSVNLDAKTEIHMHTLDPVVAGNRVVNEQERINAETIRHMRGVAR